MFDSYTKWLKMCFTVIRIHEAYVLIQLTRTSRKEFITIPLRAYTSHLGSFCIIHIAILCNYAQVLKQISFLSNCLLILILKNNFFSSKIPSNLRQTFPFRKQLVQVRTGVRSG